MFHLIDRVYLCSDTALDTNEDRVVISKDNGYQMHDVIEKLSSGLLIKYGTSVSEVITESPISFFQELLSISQNRNRPLYIYADKSSLPFIMGLWFRIMFKKPDIELCKKIFNSNIYRYNLLYKSYIAKRTANYNVKPSFNELKLLEGISSEYKISENIRKRFVLDNAKYIGIEYLLYMYLASGKLKNELKKSIKTLYKKHLDQILIEYKMYFLIYSSSNTFCKRLDISNSACDFDQQTLPEQDNRFVEFFTSNRLYSKKEITRASANNTDFKFEKMTDYDLETLSLFQEAIGTYYNNDQSTNFIADDSYITNFIQCVIGEFNDKTLDAMIKTEMDFDNPSGVFYNVKMETVNNLLVQKILRAYKSNELELLNGLSII